MLRVQKVVLFTSFLVASCSTASTSSPTNTIPSTFNDLVRRGYVTVGLDDTFAPMGFRDEDGEIVGFDVDLAKLVFEELDLEVRFQPIDWAAKVLELDAGNIDMIWNGLTITEPRKLEMLFSDPYIANRQIVMTKTGSTLNAIDDLAGKKVGVQLQSASQTAVEANDIIDQLDELLKYDTFNDALVDLRSGTIDAVVTDEIYGRYVISQTPNTYRVMDEDFGDETYGIGFRLGNTRIRDMVNDTLFDLIEDGTATAISTKWFSEDIFLPRGS